ncbi:hypothetical protein R1sor_001268 [Riccia sorocarpa]|uniref:Reverse transcriptase domain-containing protein n=1 Tax=Riccia sorocarpa TaxID=122646 RepID=A0ABD3GZN2_9MARC
MDLSVEKVDPRNQFLCLKLGSNGTREQAFLVIVYFTPAGAPVYAYLGEDSDPFAALTEMVLALRLKGSIWLAWDFNAPIKESQGCPIRVGSDWRKSEVDQWDRTSVDLERNGMTRNFLRFIDVCGLTVMNEGFSSYKITTTIQSVAREVFPPSRKRRATWFDSQCKETQQTALSSPVELRIEAFRTYKHFIRAKKRSFMRKLQESLLLEAARDPQTFWRRLRSRSSVSVLGRDERAGYVRRLYFFPDASSMPAMVGPGCIFTSEEVMHGMNNVCVGKAADLFGLTIELLKWGGSDVLEVIMSLINTACSHGLPEEWMRRQVIPLYKSGPKTDPGSYRTIMLANMFSKLIGRSLDIKLSRWCEEKGVCAPFQAGFRRGFSTMDHTLVLRVLIEESKRLRKQMFVAFIDFSKAFDTIPRGLLWLRLIQLGVPHDLIKSIVMLYEKVRVVNDPRDKETESTLGVIQGCPLSPTLFGLMIDGLYWQDKSQVQGVQLGSTEIKILLFADDVVLLAPTAEQLRLHLANLAEFCKDTQMRVNMGKIRWFCVGPRSDESFFFQGDLMERCSVYRYLGLEFSPSLKWTHCLKSRVAGGMRALYVTWNTCVEAGVMDWSLRKKLFVTIVRTTILYGSHAWGPALSRSGWAEIERIQKLFLQRELGVRTQIPHVLLLAEVGWVPMEVEALYSAIHYQSKIKEQGMQRLECQARQVTQATGWFSDLCHWASRWNFPESSWGESTTLRERLILAATHRLWADPTLRQQYYKMDISRLDSYEEAAYLSSSLPRHI